MVAVFRTVWDDIEGDSKRSTSLTFAPLTKPCRDTSKRWWLLSKSALYQRKRRTSPQPEWLAAYIDAARALGRRRPASAKGVSRSVSKGPRGGLYAIFEGEISHDALVAPPGAVHRHLIRIGTTSRFETSAAFRSGTSARTPALMSPSVTPRTRAWKYGGQSAPVAAGSVIHRRSRGCRSCSLRALIQVCGKGVRRAVGTFVSNKRSRRQSQHLTPDEAEAFVLKRLGEADYRRIEEHIQDCRVCHNRVDEEVAWVAQIRRAFTSAVWSRVRQTEDGEVRLAVMCTGVLFMGRITGARIDAGMVCDTLSDAQGWCEQTFRVMFPEHAGGLN